MKTQENKLSAFNAKKAAVNTWKENNFSLFGVINYIVKNYQTDKDLRDALSTINDLPAKPTKTQLKDLFSVDYVKQCLGERGLNKWKKDESGKLTIKGDLKTRFSLWVVLTAIQKANK